MILIISTSKEKIHNLEFCKPIEDILKDHKTRTTHYSKLTKKDLGSAKKIIIAGTSLQDNKFLENVKKFDWLKSTNKPVLGICAGFQIIGLQFGGNLKKEIEIGYYNENLKEKFLKEEGKIQVYHLHNNYITKESLKKFKIYNSGKIPQAIKHSTLPIYGTLFHPEVRNKKMILGFVENG